jgi:hypothetical protein
MRGLYLSVGHTLFNAIFITHKSFYHSQLLVMSLNKSEIIKFYKNLVIKHQMTEYTCKDISNYFYEIHCLSENSQYKISVAEQLVNYPTGSWFVRVSITGANNQTYSHTEIHTFLKCHNKVTHKFQCLNDTCHYNNGSQVGSQKNSHKIC